MNVVCQVANEVSKLRVLYCNATEFEAYKFSAVYTCKRVMSDRNGYVQVLNKCT